MNISIILFNLFEFYNLGFIIVFLFFDSIGDNIRYTYAIMYYLLNIFDKQLEQFEINSISYRLIFNCFLTTIGLIICKSLQYTNYYIALNLNYFHIMIFIFSAIQCISQMLNGNNKITINFVKIYLQIMLCITMCVNFWIDHQFYQHNKL